jgi:pimeloyl-ACP methyl ester carboxylesterase
VTIDSVPHPGWENKQVYLYLPKHNKNIHNKFPVILFCHGFGATDPQVYHHLLTHIASQGYALIYPPYKSFAMDPSQKKKYGTMIAGFEKGVEHLAPIIDTTTIGIIGHSFGAGAVPSVTWQCLVDKGWGGNKAFLFIMAPWYVYDIAEEQLENMPDHINCIVQVFKDDGINDHRMAIDIFDNFGIPEDQKNFILVQSDERFGCRLAADHSLPTGCHDPDGAENALDDYAVFRLIDALADYTFTDNPAAKKIALGNGSPAQTFMGYWPDSMPVKPLIVSNCPDTLPDIRPQNQFFNFWDNRLNPRIGSLGSDTTSDRKSLFFRSKRLLTWRNYIQSGKFFFKQGRKQVRRYQKGPVAPPKKGYGSYGPWYATVDSFPSPRWKDRFVYFFSPAPDSAVRPVVFFSHGYAMTHPYVYLPLINFLVSKGVHVIFSPYRLFAGKTSFDQKYDVLFDGFEAAMRRYRSRIDTTRVGFIGHSFGGGAVPAITWKSLMEKKWGRAGSFMFIMAPWYCFDIRQYQLDHFPATSLVMQVYDDDNLVDPRMAMDIFTTVAIPGDRKRFYVVYGDSHNGNVLEADHSTPKGSWDPRGEEDALDYYAVFKPVDACMAYSFFGDSAAKNIAFGNNTPVQRSMGRWPDKRPIKEMLITDRPDTLSFEKNYLFSWENRINPRKNTLFKTGEKK